MEEHGRHCKTLEVRRRQRYFVSRRVSQVLCQALLPGGPSPVLILAVSIHNGMTTLLRFGVALLRYRGVSSAKEPRNNLSRYTKGFCTLRERPRHTVLAIIFLSHSCPTPPPGKISTSF